jgi:hypothetical protein
VRPAQPEPERKLVAPADVELAAEVDTQGAAHRVGRLLREGEIEGIGAGFAEARLRPVNGLQRANGVSDNAAGAKIAILYPASTWPRNWLAWVWPRVVRGCRPGNEMVRRIWLSL